MADRLNHRETVLDNVQDEVSQFVTGLLAGNVPHAIAEEARQQIRLADEYESVSDYIETILRFDQKVRADDLRFSEQQRADLLNLHDVVTQYIDSVTAAYREHNPASLVKLDTLSEDIRRQVKEASPRPFG